MELMVQQGPPGADGADGEQGPPGIVNAEACGEDTILQHVFVEIGFPEACDLNTLAAAIESCISYWIDSLADGSARVGTITALVNGMAALVSGAGETVSTYPALDAIFPVDCTCCQWPHTDMS